MNKCLRVAILNLIIGISVSLSSTPSPIRAQGDPNEQYRIYNVGYSLVNISWSNDSTSLVFQDYTGQVGVQTGGEDSWHQYFVNTRQMDASGSWPLQANLTPTQQQTFEFYVPNLPHNPVTFAFISPNNRYLVYIAQNPEGRIGVADLQTGEHQVLDEAPDLISGGLNVFDDSLKVTWAEDSSAFTVLTSLPATRTYIHHVSNLNNLSGLVIRNVTESGLTFDGVQFFPNDLYDTSGSTNQVLLHDGFPNQGHFILQNVVTNSFVEIPSQGFVAGAKFLNNGQRVLYVDEEGLKQFHVPSNSVTVLNPNITSTWAAGGAYFSPNGQYLAIYDGGVNNPDALYIIPISNNRGLALFRTDTSQANLLQTLDTEPATIDYYTYATGVPTGATGGQWVMGDWDGDGVETPGVYGSNGVFYHTNALGPSSNWQGTWFGLLTGTAGNRPVAGRFDASVNHDCIGVTDSSDFPPYGTAFALYFTCNLAGGNPPKTFQWLSVLLPDSEGHSGIWEFSAGNFDPTVDAVDTIACRRGNFIAWTNTPPTTPSAAFPYAQYIGAPHSGTSQFVVGDWDSDGTDSFGLYYVTLGRLRGRDDLDWNSGLYPIDQQLDTNVVGTTSIGATSWRLH